MVFVGLGCALGQLGWLGSGSGLLDGLTELTLILVLFTDAARIDLAHLRLEGSLPARLLGIGLPLTVAAGALAAWMILYARIVVGEGLPASAFLESIVTLTVLLSTCLHGVTAYPLARRYGELLAATRARAAEEHQPVSELPVRIRHAAGAEAT